MNSNVEKFNRLSDNEKNLCVKAFIRRLALIGITINPQAMSFYELELRRFLQDNYGFQITPLELQKAVDLYAAETIGVPDNSHHYGSLNLKFIGSLLTSFLNYKRSQPVVQPAIPVDKQLQDMPELEFFRKEYLAFLSGLIERGSIPAQGNFHYHFQFLKATEQFIITQEEFKAFISEMRSLVNQEADKLGSPEQRKDYRKMYSPDSMRFKNKCREEYFIRWLKAETLQGIKLWAEQEFTRVNNLATDSRYLELVRTKQMDGIILQVA